MQRAAGPPAPYLPTELPRPTGYAPPALKDEATRVGLPCTSNRIAIPTEQPCEH